MKKYGDGVLLYDGQLSKGRVSAIKNWGLNRMVVTEGGGISGPSRMRGPWQRGVVTKSHEGYELSSQAMTPIPHHP
eukprot:756578-Hanusia_phi.AAC.1